MGLSAVAQHPTPLSENFGGVSVRKVHCNYRAVKKVSFLVRSVSGQIVKAFSLLPWLVLFKTCFARKPVKPGFFHFGKRRMYCRLIGKAGGILLTPPQGKPGSNLFAKISQFGSAVWQTSS